MTSLSQFFAQPGKRSGIDIADDFQLSMRTTANCRHNAAARLQLRGRIAFGATTLLSLGLVFVPLMQNSDVDLALKDKVLNMVQIFLAVAVLVYSTVIATARYDARALQLSTCADRIKDLIHGLKLARIQNNGTVPTATLTETQKRYCEILTSCENHEPIDYGLAMLQMPNDYVVHGGTELILKAKGVSSKLTPFFVPVVLLLAVIIVVSEMFGVTEFSARHLSSWRNNPTARTGVEAKECPAEETVRLTALKTTKKH